MDQVKIDNNTTDFFAHSLDETALDQWHKLATHLNDVATLSKNFANEFNAGELGYAAGLLHDVGKYSYKFQQRLHGSREDVDHATAGAKLINELASTPYDKVGAALISYAIAGHHSGLADFFNLQERLQKKIEPLDDQWCEELDRHSRELWPHSFQSSKDGLAFQLAFLGRMIFSCLVDADYKDTERFYAQAEQRIVDREWPDLRAQIDLLIDRYTGYMETKKQNAQITELNTLRSNILDHVRSRADLSPGLFTLTVPTGGGKTLASLGFALDHAKKHNLRRIIYAIPFTSIIDQNAAVFRDVLGDDYILEHHSSIDDEKFQDREQWDKLRLAMEDWAAPVIVTSNVQLFESLFANHPAKCRKLHNLSNSIIILDEAQTLPLKLLRPCMAALDELARNYGATIVLCTATQPALDKRNFKAGGLALEGRELAPDPTNLVRKLDRVKIIHGQELSDEALVSELHKHDQALVIVNTRKHALNLYQTVKSAGLIGAIHLTTRQYATHRQKILEEVRKRLDPANPEPCRLIATSLVEAGVDLDFPQVWRAETGLDQIAQAAGRCNREGRRPKESSVVTVFPPKEVKSPCEIKQLAEDFYRIAGQYDHLLTPEAINAYFREVYWRKGAEQLDANKILDAFILNPTEAQFNYQTAAQDFQMIKNGLTPIIINDVNKDDKGIVKDTLARLENSAASPGKAARELQPFLVQVPPKAAHALRDHGRADYHREDLWGDQFLVLTDHNLYTLDVGLIWEDPAFQDVGDLMF